MCGTFDNLVTKDYFKAELAQLESRLTTRMLTGAGIIIAAVGIIVKL